MGLVSEWWQFGCMATLYEQKSLGEKNLRQPLSIGHQFKERARKVKIKHKITEKWFGFFV